MTTRLEQENIVVVLQKELETFKEGNKRLKNEIDILREQLYKKKTLPQSEKVCYYCLLISLKALS